MNQPVEYETLKKRFSTLESWRNHELKWLPQTGSTNDDLKALLLRESITHCLEIADYQTTGRGLHGRPWFAEPATSLLFSFTWIWRNTDAIWQFPLKVALALFSACRKFVSEDNALWLKWPNDLCLKNGKLAGILIESSMRKDALYSVVGIGININSPLKPGMKLEDAAMPPAALADCFSGTGNHVMPSRVELLESFAMEWDACVRSIDTKCLLEEYSKAAKPFWGKAIKIIFGDGSISEGTASCLAEDGTLIILEKNGRQRRVRDACRIILA